MTRTPSSHSSRSRSSEEAHSAIKKRRTYHSPIRQQQSEATRKRMIDAGVELVRSFHSWDWTNLTCRAVAQKADLSERTVYRHFATERQLRDAIMQRLVEMSGIDLTHIEVNSFHQTATVILQELAQYSASTQEPSDPSLDSIDAFRRQSLLQAVKQATPQWSEQDQEMTAATLDLLWNPYPHERMASAWQFDIDKTIQTVHWIVKLVQQAIDNNQPPSAL